MLIRPRHSRRAARPSVCFYTSDHRNLVADGALLVLGEEIPGLHPAMCFLEYLSRVGLEDDSFARPKSPRVDRCVIGLRQLPQEVVLVRLRFLVDVPLCPL